MPDPLPHLIRLVWWTCTGPPGPAWGTHTNTQLWCTVRTKFLCCLSGSGTPSPSPQHAAAACSWGSGYFR